MWRERHCLCNASPCQVTFIMSEVPIAAATTPSSHENVDQSHDTVTKNTTDNVVIEDAEYLAAIAALRYKQHAPTIAAPLPPSSLTNSCVSANDENNEGVTGETTTPRPFKTPQSNDVLTTPTSSLPLTIRASGAAAPRQASFTKLAVPSKHINTRVVETSPSVITCATPINMNKSSSPSTSVGPSKSNDGEEKKTTMTILKQSPTKSSVKTSLSDVQHKKQDRRQDTKGGDGYESDDCVRRALLYKENASTLIVSKASENDNSLMSDDLIPPPLVANRRIPRNATSLLPTGEKDVTTSVVEEDDLMREAPPAKRKRGRPYKNTPTPINNDESCLATKSTSVHASTTTGTENSHTTPRPRSILSKTIRRTSAPPPPTETSSTEEASADTTIPTRHIIYIPPQQSSSEKKASPATNLVASNVSPSKSPQQHKTLESIEDASPQQPSSGSLPSNDLVVNTQSSSLTTEWECYQTLSDEARLHWAQLMQCEAQRQTLRIQMDVCERQRQKAISAFGRATQQRHHWVEARFSQQQQPPQQQ